MDDGDYLKPCLFFPLNDQVRFGHKQHGANYKINSVGNNIQTLICIY